MWERRHALLLLLPLSLLPELLSALPHYRERVRDRPSAIGRATLDSSLVAMLRCRSARSARRAVR